MDIDEQYRNLVTRVLTDGEWSDNRTGIRTLFDIGAYLKIDCSENFPLLTTKRVFWKSAFAEMLGFIRAYRYSQDFEVLGCNVWKANANENQEWLNNPHRRGDGHLGDIYGHVWRRGFIQEVEWGKDKNKTGYDVIDQLKGVVDKLSQDIDDRRLIVSAWHPELFQRMCLLPCHYAMQFSLTKQKTTLDLSVTQRSWDLGLGCPYNIAQYAFLLHLIAQITGKQVGNLHYHATNVHIYENHIEQLKEQMTRVPKQEKPKIVVNKGIFSLKCLEDKKRFVDDYVMIEGYNPHPAIKMEMAV